MAIPVWPAALPQELITDGYGQQAPNTIIATQMDVGPGKRRRRTSAGVQPVQGQIVVTEAQLETLRAFFRTDLGDGALRFQWIDPVSSPNPAGDARMVLDGTSGTFASTPHSEAVDITGDMALVAKIAPEGPLTSTNNSIINRWDWRYGSVFDLALRSGGTARLRWRSETNAEIWHTVHLPDGLATPFWLAVTLSFDEQGSTSTFFFSQDGVTWETLGEPDAKEGVTGIFLGVSPLEIGAVVGGNAEHFPGTIYRAQVWEGAGFDLNSGPTGTLAADFNAEDAPRSLSGGGAFTSSATGEVWTLHGNATIHNPTVGVPVEMRFTEPPQWSARTSGIYTVSLALEILP